MNDLPLLNLLEQRLSNLKSSVSKHFPDLKKLWGDFLTQKHYLPLAIIIINIFIMFILGMSKHKTPEKIVLSSVNPLQSLALIQESREAQQLPENKEVFGFAPYWTFDKLDNVDFNTLTTLAYFSITVDGNGNLIKDDPGYTTFKSDKATQIFKKAHSFGTKVVLTLTQMQNGPIITLLDNPDAQDNLINQAVDEVQNRGIDGINVDLEYPGDPGQDYRNKFSQFVANLTARMHEVNPQSQVTVSVYAASAKDPKLYDIGPLAQNSDGIFMMAYDFAVAGSTQAIPTAPLYGHKEGEYWYDVSTAVDDFLAVMPAEKLILGVPWYGYNYSVAQPGVKANTYYYGGVTQTYSAAQDSVYPDMAGITDFQSGWDALGQVGWRAYHTLAGVWRMIFVEDERSLGVKYDFAKNKNLKGVGIWALGFDDGKNEMWNVLKDKFGSKNTDAKIAQKPSYEIN